MIREERLKDILRKYFDIGDSYEYSLTRDKRGFAVGTVTVEDFEEFDDEKIADLADYLLEEGVIPMPCKTGETIYKICPAGVRWDGDPDRLCKCCPWQYADCSDIGFQKDMNNTVKEISAGDEVYIMRREKQFGKIYFRSSEEAWDAIEKKQSASRKERIK